MTVAGSKRAVSAQRALAALIADARRMEVRHRAQLAQLPARVRPDAVNLLHYLAIRRHDLRPLQRRLSALGLSSLGRCEAQVLATLTAAHAAAAALAGPPSPSPADRRFANGRTRLRRAGRELLGPAARGREVRVMVTLPGESARDGRLMRDLIDGGMEIARINCAHDDAATWRTLAATVRAAARARRRTCRVAMELAGPKLRTLLAADHPAVVRWKPPRDALGVATAPARIALISEGAPADGFAATLPIGALVAGLRRGDVVELDDTRDRPRQLRVIAGNRRLRIAECGDSARVIDGSVLRVRRGRRLVASGIIAGLPPPIGELRLQIGDRLVVGAIPPRSAAWRQAPRIDCTMPEVYAMVRVGERVVFDDGRLAGLVRACHSGGLAISITVAPAGGATLRSDKGLNLPDSDLRLPALTAKDRADLVVASEIADLVGLSFVRDADDVRALHAALPPRRIGVIIKIETARAFAALPRILIAALARPPAGMMIARGDLAAEIGFVRLAEVQEEILWLCEAARVPVVWATQVLDRLAKKGVPTRAEVTDAAMAGRAECVMLNKGPYIRAVLPFLTGVLARMAGHQDKKRSMLRALAVGSALDVPPVTERR